MTQIAPFGVSCTCCLHLKMISSSSLVQGPFAKPLRITCSHLKSFNFNYFQSVSSDLFLQWVGVRLLLKSSETSSQSTTPSNCPSMKSLRRISSSRDQRWPNNWSWLPEELFIGAAVVPVLLVRGNTINALVSPAEEKWNRHLESSLRLKAGRIHAFN